MTMPHKIRRSLSIVITESWTIVWDDEVTRPAAPEPGCHIIEWDEGEAPPEMVVLHRRADGSGWEVKSQGAE
ncbi:MAG: hypothetical protein KJZ86_24935 [Caldilineaceae bacterium]|nr:hypothetical protein [Caldilineaceae bacterium]HRJ43765.1 hypothetical protein [Caldilineaceae bacterium]